MRATKVQVVIARSLKEREMMMSKILINNGFARIITDAKKLIYDDLPASVLDSCYFVALRDVNLHDNDVVMEKLINMAMHEHFVVIGTSFVPNKYKWACDITYSDK